jgi:phosphoglycolate phosphatase
MILTIDDDTGTHGGPFSGMSINKLLQRYPGGQPAAILFDLDGTLVDSAPDIASALDNAMRGAGLEPPGDARTRDWIGNGPRVLVLRALAWAVDQSPDNLDPSLMQAVFDGFLAHYADSNGASSQLYDGVQDALQYWQQRSVAMAVVTNKPLPFVAPLLAALGIEHYFSLLLGGECVPEKKPSPLPLLHACKQLGAKPGHSLMVGDSSNDVLAARTASVPVVGVRGGYNRGDRIEDSQPDAVIDTLAELRAVSAQ